MICSLRKQNCLLSTMPQGRARPFIQAPGVTDMMSGHMKDLRCLKREQAASRDSTLKGFKYQAGNRIRYSLSFLCTLRICVTVMFRPCRLSSTQIINKKWNIEANGRHNSLYPHQYVNKVITTKSSYCNSLRPSNIDGSVKHQCLSN